MTKNIILDLDDTLGDLKVRLQNIFRKKTGRSDIHYRDWTEFNKSNYGFTFDDLTEFFIEDNSLALMRPHIGIVETTARLKELGYNIHIVTARGWHPNAEAVTKAWLAEHNVTYDQLHIVPFAMCKEEYTRIIPDVAMFVDDRIDHCDAMHLANRVENIILFGQPWNSHLFESRENKPMNFHRIEDIRELLRFV